MASSYIEYPRYGLTMLLDQNYDVQSGHRQADRSTDTHTARQKSNKAIAMMHRKSPPSENIYILQKIIVKQIFLKEDVEMALILFS